MRKDKDAPSFHLDPLRRAALEQLRATRLKIDEEHPRLLADMRKRILCRESPQCDELKIDREKNLRTVAQFLMLTSVQGQSIHARLQDILSRNTHI